MELVREGIHYKEEKEALRVTEIDDAEGEVILPDQVDGKKVTAIDGYVFSRSKVASLTLPKYLKESGNYLFYRCFSLKKLRFSNGWDMVGSGTFTGCEIQKIIIDFYDGEKSCLKYILDEQRYFVEAILRYHKEDGEVKEARLVFPEHYEEAVENTPARIVMTHYHGSGGDYRQAFYDKEVNFLEYDSLLARAVAEESEETVTQMAACRLAYPYKLTDEAKERYLAYLKEHMECAVGIYMEKEDLKMFRFFAEEKLWSKEELELAIDLATKKKTMEILSFLMDTRQRQFPKKKKTFEW